MKSILDSRFRGNDGSGMYSGACPGHRSGVRRNDKIAGSIQLCKGHPIIYKDETPARRSHFSRKFEATYLSGSLNAAFGFIRGSWAHAKQ
ncbi:MAG: hypothetical protein ABR911_13080 [Syntrophales bacterium]